MSLPPLERINEFLHTFLPGYNTPSPPGNRSNTSPLVYPRELPEQVAPSRKGNQHHDTFDTQFVDYLRIQIYRTQGSDGANPYTWSGAGASGFNEPFAGQRERNAIAKTIYLYLPAGLNERYSTDYNTTTLGPAGVAAGGALNELVNTGGLTNESATKTLMGAAGTAKPQLVMNTAASALGAVNSALGADSNISGDELSAIASKKIFNPYQEVTFRGVQYRTHSFTFKMSPRNPSEAQECYQIISHLRNAMLPSYSSGSSDEWSSDAAAMAFGTGGGSFGGARYLNIPDIMRLALMRVEAKLDDSGNWSTDASRPTGLSKLMRYPTKCVLSNLEVDATPDGQYNSLKNAIDNEEDYGPAAMNVTLEFQETSFVTREMVRDPASRTQNNRPNMSPFDAFRSIA